MFEDSPGRTKKILKYFWLIQSSAKICHLVIDDFRSYLSIINPENFSHKYVHSVTILLPAITLVQSFSKSIRILVLN